MKMYTYTGTEAYLAPEVIEDLEYTEMADMWSAGVVLFMLLTGQHPFHSEKEDLIKEITNCKIEFKGEAWKKISSEARDLVSKLLEKDYTKRYSAIQVLNHPWIKSEEVEQTNQIELPGSSPSDTLQKKKFEKDRALAYRSKFIYRGARELESQI